MPKAKNTPEVSEDTLEDQFAGVVEQGQQAQELGLTEAACPYSEGANRDAWLRGFGG